MTSPLGVRSYEWPWLNNAFGEAPKGGAGNFYTRFPGQYYDVETGLHYNMRRYYDPDTGRYIQSDPIGLEGGLNTYSYVSNVPLDGIDPSGLQVTGPGRPLRFHGTGLRVRVAPMDLSRLASICLLALCPPDHPLARPLKPPPNQYTLLCFRAACHSDRNFCSATFPGIRDEFFNGGYPTVADYERSNPDCTCTRYGFPDQIQSSGPPAANAWDLIEVYSKILETRVVP
ncbi:RHS repeat-associated core domain-containing protein [Frateuria sp. GZRR33]|uniref:RHS repeat-associated core domain-containing protein n=1 Tax=Frateuria sp. GZRR33 TaxID=3351535 RepID=UPI003EDC314A